MRKKKFAKKMLLVGALGSGIVSVSSMFNEAQAYIPSGKQPHIVNCYDKYGHRNGFGNSCVTGSGGCTAHYCNF